MVVQCWVLYNMALSKGKPLSNVKSAYSNWQYLYRPCLLPFFTHYWLLRVQSIVSWANWGLFRKLSLSMTCSKTRKYPLSRLSSHWLIALCWSFGLGFSSLANMLWGELSNIDHLCWHSACGLQLPRSHRLFRIDWCDR